MPTSPSTPIETIKLSVTRVRTRGSRSLWLQQALGPESPAELQSLAGHHAADVCIIGGGFTGLWTALELKRREPSIEVTVLEADICGAGASGRNGGFALTWWAHFQHLLGQAGAEAAVTLAQRSEQAVRQIGLFCQERGIAEAYRERGWMWAATNPSQMGGWDDTLKLLDQHGQHPYEQLTPQQVAQRCGSPAHLGGIFEPVSAAVQPALIARELAKAAREAGVTIYERSQVTSIEPNASATSAGANSTGTSARRATITTFGGSLTASQVLVATNAWAAQIPEIGKGLVVVASDIIATEPIPERLSEIGFANGMLISDGRRLVNYYHASADGRLIFGKGGGTLGFRNRITKTFDHPGRRADAIRTQMVRAYPTLWNANIEEAWSGPVDYSLSGMPFFVRLTGAPNVLVCAGFSGDGVGPSRLAGDVLAEMLIDGGDAGLPKVLTTVPRQAMPPEPIRYLGGKVVRAAVARKEAREDLARQPRVLDRVLAALDPTGYTYQGEPDDRDTNVTAPER